MLTIFNEALFNSTALVTLAEIGDKTQLLSIILAARFRVFWPIFFGVLVATTLNHGVAAWFGSALASSADPEILRYISGGLFIVLGLWMLIPDKEPEQKSEPKYGAFLTALVAFFIAEMGDKTQFATITLGAKYAETWAVVVGTTLGMMIANVPAILLGEKVLKVIPLNIFRIAASVLFVGFGLLSLLYKI